jgi:hypothetical protein
MRKTRKNRHGALDPWYGPIPGQRSRKKYADIPVATEPAPADLSKRERNQLVALVRKFGAKAVIAAVEAIEQQDRHRQRRGRGAPSQRSKRIHLAMCIEEWAEEYRQDGHRTPYKQATLDWIEFEGNPPDPKILKAIKKDRLQGRQELLEYLECLEQHSHMLAKSERSSAERSAWIAHLRQRSLTKRGSE